MLEQPKKKKPRIAPLSKKWFISPIIIGLLICFSLVIGGTGGNLYQKQKSKNGSSLILGEEKNIYLSFTKEIYDKIKTNYWKKISDEELANLFLLAVERLTGQIQNPKEKSQEVVLKTIRDILKQIENEEEQKSFIIQLNDLVLNNLEPFGRSHLYSQEDEKLLSQKVQNITDQDHYQTLGLDKKASSQEIEKAYQELTSQLNQQRDNPQVQEKLSQVDRAYQTLKDENARLLYKNSGIEPTISSNLPSPSILYLHLTKFSPTTFDELQQTAEKFREQPELDTLILDLRENIGGAIDSLPYLLGPFIGYDQYAYQFLHQGEKADYKTKTGWLPGLVQYKKVVILINENTQSSAEIMASVLKKYNVGVLVGTTTRGWGTIEKVFGLDNQISQNETYSVFLAHSLTLREDGQPIESLGIEPHIFTSKASWPQELYSYLPDSNLIDIVSRFVIEPKGSPKLPANEPSSAPSPEG
jgi:hypothetical protein